MWPSHSKWLSKWSNKSASNFTLSLNIPPWNLFRWFRRPQLWATGDGQLPHDNALIHALHLMWSFLAKYQTQVTQPPYSTDLVPWNFWLFPKLKSPLKMKRFQTVCEIQENKMGQLMATGRTMWGPKVPTLKWTEVSLSYLQCVLYLVSFSINVPIFHSTWLDTFWTDPAVHQILTILQCEFNPQVVPFSYCWPHTPPCKQCKGEEQQERVASAESGPCFRV